MQLVGLRPFMQWSLLDRNGDPIRAVRAVDTVVDPSYRRAGLFSNLTRAALKRLEDQGFDIVFNTPNDRSGPGYEKMGWTLLGQPTLSLRVRNPVSLVMGRLTRRSRPANRGRSSSPDWLKFSVSQLHDFKEDSYSGGYHVLKDLQFLRWRYEAHPLFDYRTIRITNRKGETSHLAIVREDQRGSFFGTAVSEVIGRSVSAATLRAICSAVFEATDSQYVIFGLPQVRQEGTLGTISSGTLAGCFPVKWRNVNFAVRPITLEKSRHDMLFDLKQWHLVLGDLEVF